MQLKLACNNLYEFHLQQVTKVGSETVGGWRLLSVVRLPVCLIVWPPLTAASRSHAQLSAKSLKLLTCSNSASASTWHVAATQFEPNYRRARCTHAHTHTYKSVQSTYNGRNSRMLIVRGNVLGRFCRNFVNGSTNARVALCQLYS